MSQLFTKQVNLRWYSSFSLCGMIKCDIHNKMARVFNLFVNITTNLANYFTRKLMNVVNEKQDIFKIWLYQTYFFFFERLSNLFIDEQKTIFLYKDFFQDTTNNTLMHFCSQTKCKRQIWLYYCLRQVVYALALIIVTICLAFNTSFLAFNTSFSVLIILLKYIPVILNCCNSYAK